jgi:hypothetical protein
MAHGQKTGGRTAGTPNKATSSLLELVEAEAGGPLPVLLARAGRKAEQSGDLQLAVAAWAKAAAFVYPRMSTAEPPGPPLPPVVISFADPKPCTSCGHDPKDRVHITREVIHGPPTP